MKAAILTAPNALVTGEVADPAAEPGDLILRVRAATICGTDIRIWRGRKTAGVRYPSVIGHEFSGDVIEGGGLFQPGQRVSVCPPIPCGGCHYCQRGMENLCPDLIAIGYEIDGGFAEYIRIPARALAMGNAHLLPDHVSHEEAALVEPMACVLNGQDKVGLTLGDTVVILGSGPIGTLHIKLAKLRGAGRIIVSEPNAGRRKMALDAGADVAIDPTATDLRAAVLAETRGLGADVAICAIGIPALAREAVGLVRKRGRVSLFAGFSKGEIGQLDINAVHYDEITLTGAFGLTRANYGDSLNLIADGRIEVASMVSHRYGLEDCLGAFEMAEGGGAMKVALIND
ncbi:zinc-dependent dehydrogenase [Pseudogemmobacter humi]|uniref:D-arabitol-phosphate dehydrogenase n=1 Tax=Pseudogemmobacter humi TaxID=2483812 RepID=A0A3P5XFM3_9RHOB|nr:zinc-dependent dehydrogenase [Pseudogemmobacter humi]VDC33632.1 D-arabitol-phosphate dehydrogenase [Pseudogemmobacter humi]